MIKKLKIYERYRGYVVGKLLNVIDELTIRIESTIISEI